MNKRLEMTPEINIYTKKGILYNVKRYAPFYIIFALPFLWYVIFAYLPMTGAIIAFKDYNFADGMFGSRWVGLENFQRFINNGDFWLVFKNTIVISLLRTIFGFPAPIIFALLLNEVKAKKYKRVLQTISYLPHFVSWVVISGILFSFFSSTGIINKLIMLTGADVIPFLSSEKYFRTFLVGSAVWKEVGWSAIIYLAALSGVDAQLYEAADIDGANRRQKLWNITLPSIRNVVSVMFILSFANVLSAGFEQVLVMINPSVTEVAEVIDYYIYRVGLTQVNNYSYASAVGLFKAVISLGLVLTTNFISKKIDEDGGI